MILNRISIINYKNLAQIELECAPKLNCFIGHNGMGKTNLLDAVYYLSFCKSASNPIDSQNIRHGEDFFVIQGSYQTEKGEEEEVYCGMKRGRKKQFKHNKKEYQRFADHIGLIPLVMVSPDDASLIVGGSDERRKFMDMVISQYDKAYLDALIHYNKTLQQRNSLLKADAEPDADLMNVLEEMLAKDGNVIFEKRTDFVHEFILQFQEIHAAITLGKEVVSLCYQSDLQKDDLKRLLENSRAKDRIMGYTLKGTHKDDLLMGLGNYAIRREGSQGQNKTYLTALKLAQFMFLKHHGSNTTPILLLDDIFDKLDALRVEQIVRLVSEPDFGQIFVTDTNRDHLEEIVGGLEGEHKVFHVENGTVS
ncbi:MAG: DNA replication and repair protein RecF [Bacteroidales bacterium]|nr:DNA replication and repair protein RecF [Bacteroidales bacterium]